jgi:hypothetical protein
MHLLPQLLSKPRSGTKLSHRELLLAVASPTLLQSVRSCSELQSSLGRLPCQELLLALTLPRHLLKLRSASWLSSRELLAPLLGHSVSHQIPFGEFGECVAIAQSDGGSGLGAVITNLRH